MARQTRSQRRARREAQAASAPRAQTRAPRQIRPAQDPVAAHATPAAPERAHRGGPVGFVGESVAELKKVEWPGQQQVIQGTAVVIIACVIVGIYLYGADLIFKRVVQNLLLGQ